jgi:MFS family permease
VALHHNVFSYFPFNVEMHYLLAMHLHGGPSAPWAGMYLAQLMHATMCALAVVAVYGLAGGGRRGVAAGLLMAAAPWVPLLASVAYNDGGTLLFGVLAIGWAIRARSMRAFILAGLMAGFAGGTKLSILPLLFVGVPIILILVRPIPWRSVSGGCAIYLLAGAAALSPWLIRNDAWTGNPVFPEAMRIFGKAHFSDVQVERWRQAYLPDKDHRSVGGHLSALETQILADWRYGVALLPLGIATFLITFRKPAALYLMGLLLFQLLFWLFFTHLQSRFMVIAIPIIALMIAQSERREWFWVCTLTAVGMICYCGVTVTMKLERSLALDRRLVSANGVGILGRQNFEGFRLLDIKSLRPGASVDLVGDSCAFLYQIPMTRLHYKTVFDVDTSDRSKSIVQDWLAGMPRDALPWLDASGSADLARFAKTYYAIPPLPPAPIWK